MKHIDNSNRILSFPSAASSRNLSFPTSGPLTIPMTNDYLFRALLQRNNKVLRGLICSLLHLSSDEVTSVEITNPIELGTSMGDKTFILDIKVMLNDLTIINLEMQVVNQYNWIERSLSYLCRNFDNLQSGEPYENVKPVIQIGLLNFTLFPDNPEFYAIYQLLNVKNYSVYSDKLRLCVLDLTHIDIATEEDRVYQLDYWASLFQATTWEELNMLAQNNEYLEEASATVYQLSQEERVRMECEAREDYYRTQRGLQYRLDRQEAEINARNAKLEAQSAELKKQSAEMEARSAKIEAQSAEIETQSAEIKAQSAEIKAQSAEIENLNGKIDKLHAWMKAHGYDPENI